MNQKSTFRRTMTVHSKGLQHIEAIKARFPRGVMDHNRILPAAIDYALECFAQDPDLFLQRLAVTAEI